VTPPRPVLRARLTPAPGTGPDGPAKPPATGLRAAAAAPATVVIEAGDGDRLRVVGSCALGDLGLVPGAPPDGPEVRAAPGLDVAAIARALPGGRFEPVWLELPSPRGYLHVLPWEALLLGLRRPLWRASRTAPLPRPGRASLTVAVVAGGWPGEPRGLPDRPTEAWTVPTQCRADVRVFAGPPAVDPAAPWLPGVRASLDGHPLDVLHLVSPGVFTDGRGAVRAPDGHPVGAEEITAFLDRTGAWCLMLTGSSRTGSLAALRDLADAIATTRPCVTLTHDADEPHEPPADLIPGRNLAPLFGRAFGTEATGSAPPASPAVACWVAPSFVNGHEPAELDPA